METLEAIRQRRSIRKYTGEPVPREALETIVDAGRLAATGYNAQPWEFVVVTDPAMLEKIQIRPWMDKAAAVIAVVLDREQQYWQEDGAAAIQNMLVATTALGYGACWIQGATRRHEERVKPILNIPADKYLVSLVSVGVPAETPTVEKKSLGEVLHWEMYQD